MRQFFNIIILTLIFTNCVAQSLPESVLKDEQVLLAFGTFEIKSKFNKINPQDLEEPLGKEIFDDLKLQLEKEKKLYWKRSDFENRLLVIENQPIDIKSAKLLLKNIDDEKRKNMIRDFRNYNSGGQFYRSFPLSVSKPVYSTNGQYAVIG